MRRSALIFALVLPGWLFAQDSISVAERIHSYADPMLAVYDFSMADPALRTYEHSASLSRVGGAWHHHSASKPLDMSLGDGQDYGQVGATSYMRHHSQTLWGHAFYRKGRLRNVRLNSVADPQTLYPYLTADSVGGSLEMERYSLGGGYSAVSGRWSWGASLDYDAGLYYRAVDPRPKDITGLLSLGAGVGYSISAVYSATVSAHCQKYKQTCDILTVSETGRTPVFHLTGGSNHYVRFAGASETSYYGGTRYGLTFGLFPRQHSGLMAMARLERFQLTKTLTDVNKLPLCQALHRQIDAQVGWTSAHAAIWAEGSAYRRHGTENLFGDATSGVYPQIGSLTMYADNHRQCSLHVLYDYILQAGASSVWIDASVGYAHRSTIYLEPKYQRLLDQCGADVSVGWRKLSGRVAWSTNADMRYTHPYKTRLDLDDRSDDAFVKALVDAEMQSYHLLSSDWCRASAAGSVSYVLDPRHALGATVSYAHGFRHRVTTDTFEVTIMLYF